MSTNADAAAFSNGDTFTFVQSGQLRWCVHEFCFAAPDWKPRLEYQRGEDFGSSIGSRTDAADHCEHNY